MRVQIKHIGAKVKKQTKRGMIRGDTTYWEITQIVEAMGVRKDGSIRNPLQLLQIIIIALGYGP